VITRRYECQSPDPAARLLAESVLRRTPDRLEPLAGMALPDSLVLVLSVLVVNSRYPGSWANAIGVPLVAWVAALVVLYALAAGLSGFEAVGVPGV